MEARELILRWLQWKGPDYRQGTLAEAIGMKPSYLSQILSGKRNPGTQTLKRIASALGITIEEFWGGPVVFGALSGRATIHPATVAIENNTAHTSLGNEERDREMSDSEILGSIMRTLCTLDSFRLTKALGYLEGLSEDAKAEKNISQVS